MPNRHAGIFSDGDLRAQSVNLGVVSFAFGERACWAPLTIPPDFSRVPGNSVVNPLGRQNALPEEGCITFPLGDTRGLLQRSAIVAGEIAPVGKETDRHWEQGEDPSMVDFKVAEFRKSSKLVIAEALDRKRWRVGGVRVAIRKSGLSPTTVYAILDGRPVRPLTLATFKRAVDG